MCENDKDIVLGRCYHDGVVYATGYATGYATDKGVIELDDKLFTNLDFGIDGGVEGELNRLASTFNPSKDIPRFAVALKPVRIVSEKDDGNDPGCDNCGCNDRVDGEIWCKGCLENNCFECGEPFGDCCCSDDYEDSCGGCVGLNSCCCCYCCYDDDDDDNEFDQEDIADTFRPMNAFARARWLKS